VVNEIHYDPVDEDAEFVELLNRSAAPVDLQGLAFGDAGSGPRAIVDQSRSLSPDSFVVLVRDQAAFNRAFPAARNALVPVGSWPALNNGGDAVVLYNRTGDGSAGGVVDSVAYDPSWGGREVSLERIDPGGPSSRASNFASSSAPSGGTPGAVNSRFAPDTVPPAVRLAEAVFADSDAQPTVDVYFSEPLDAASVAPSDFQLADGRLPRAVTLLDAAIRVRLAFDAPLSGLTLTATAVQDLSGNQLDEATVPLAYQPAPGDLVINEVMYDPRTDAFDGRPDQPEYFELVNRAARPLSVQGGYWTDRPDEFGVADTLRFDPVPRAVRPGGYAVVFALDTDGAPEAPSRLARSFPAVDFGAPERTLVPVTGASLGLLNGGSTIRLHRRDGRVITVTRYQPDWHDPNRPTTDGVSLERVAPDDTLDTALQWTSSTTDAGGTPGLPNAARRSPDARLPASGDLVVNEILYAPLADPDDGRPDQVEYLELINRSSDTLELDGLFLTDAPDETGAADTLVVGFRPTALAPGGYAVLFAKPDRRSEAASTSRLARAFPDADLGAAGVALLPVPRSTLGLPNRDAFVRIHAADGRVVASVRYRPRWHAARLDAPTGIALERVDPSGPDNAATNWASSPAQAGGTPGARNAVRPSPDGTRPLAVDALAVTEVMYAPRAAPDDGRPDQVEYVEFINRTSAPLELNGLFLTDAPDEDGAADTLRVVRRPTSLPAGGRLVVFAAPEATASPEQDSRLARAFPDVDLTAPAVVLAPQRAASLGLTNEGDLVRAHRADGVVVTETAYVPAWHAAGLQDPTGVALERISLAAGASAASNWTSSVASAGGTPGAPNSVALDEAPPSSTLSVAPSPFSPDGDGFEDATRVQYQLESAASLVRVRIFDSAGRLVRMLEDGRLVGAEGALIWDGRDADGNPLRIGPYVVLFEAVDARGGTVQRMKEVVVLAQPLN
jgi:hypothetical protein